MAKTTGDQTRARKGKIGRLKELGVDPYPPSFQRTHTVEQLILERDSLEGLGRRISCAGRVVRYNRKGKLCFLHIKDGSGRIQLAISSSEVGEHTFEVVKLIDLGDWIGAAGSMITTKTGEYSLYAKELILLAKALRPLPIPKEKQKIDGNVEVFNAFKDEETRYRQRYLDLALNDRVRDVFIRRSAIISSIRGYLEEAGYLEVETPVLQPVYGGARARPFRTHHHSAGMDLFLRISNELYLKRCIIGGLERVFEFARDFRNEGMDRTHNPEFTLLEFYEAYADYHTMMDHVERIIQRASRAVHGSHVFAYQGSTIDVSSPWPRKTLREIIREVAHIDVDESPDRAVDILADRGIASDVTPADGKDRGRLAIQLFEKLVAPQLVQPHIIMDFPKVSAPLCKAHREKPGLIEQFEVYTAGLELVNAYTEQNDPREQRIQLDKEAFPVDDDFLFALESGMPPAGGVGIGIDRLVMLLTDSLSLRDVLLFPLVKPIH